MYERIQKRTSELLSKGSVSDKPSQYVDMILFILIILNITAVCLESVKFIGDKYKVLINDIDKDVNLKNILSKKDDTEREETLVDLIVEIKEMNQLKQIEFLENKVAKNLDESSYSELIKLKSQLNRE